MFKMSTLVLPALIASGASCSPWGTKMSSDPQPEARLLALLDKQPEARDWIRNSRRDVPLASNRFEGKEEALAFVDALYETGAVKVVIDGIIDDEIEMAEGG